MDSYTVLMSVYYKEKPEFLYQSMESIYMQTVPTNDFVLVCDGPLTEELDSVISKMQSLFGKVLNVIRLEQNSGLGNALNEGLKYCKNEIIVRMDSDDISFVDRCEKQLMYMENNPEVKLLSGIVLEFDKCRDNVTGERKVPVKYEDICKFSKTRNPFNHPAIMVRKSEVEKAGGYTEEFPLLEDYYLWIRILNNGGLAGNLGEPIVYMRTPTDMYKRRGGYIYAKNILKFSCWMKKIGWSSNKDFIFGAIPHAIVCVMPNFIRKGIYKFLH